jgi:hypothetical protein
LLDRNATVLNIRDLSQLGVEVGEIEEVTGELRNDWRLYLFALQGREVNIGEEDMLDHFNGSLGTETVLRVFAKQS